MNDMEGVYLIPPIHTTHRMNLFPVVLFKILRARLETALWNNHPSQKLAGHDNLHHGF